MNGILKKDLRVVLTGVMIFISYQDLFKSGKWNKRTGRRIQESSVFNA